MIPKQFWVCYWIFLCILFISADESVTWHSVLSINLKRKFDSLLFYTVNPVNGSQHKLTEYAIATPISRDRTVLNEFCGMLPVIDPDVCELCTAVVQHNRILQHSRDYDLDNIDQVTVNAAKDLTVKYLTYAYDGISKAYFQDRDTRTVCVFGNFSNQVLTGIAALHDGIQLTLKYYIFDRANTFEVDRRNWYIHITNARVTYPLATIQVYVIQQELPVHTLSTCDIIHWRETLPPNQPYSMESEHLDEVNIQDIATITAQMQRLQGSNHQYQPRLPIIYEHNAYSHRIPWIIPFANSTRYIEWYVLGRGHEGILVPVFAHDLVTTCGNLIFPMHIYQHLEGYVTELFVGEIIASPNHTAYETMLARQRRQEEWIRTPTNTTTAAAEAEAVVENTTKSMSVIEEELSSWCAKYTFFITYDVNFYIETAHGLQYMLQRIGCNKVLIMGMFDYAAYLTLQHAQQEAGEYIPLLQITLGPHRPSMLTQYYIIFHTENTWDSFLFDARYQYIVQDAWRILVYSTANIPYLHSIGRETGYALIPMYTSSVYYEVHVHCRTERRSNCTVEDTDSWDLVIAERSEMVRKKQKTSFPRLISTVSLPMDEGFAYPNLTAPAMYDISLIGSQSDRRNSILTTVERRSKEDGFIVLVSHKHGALDPFDVYTREFFIIHSKIILNIHQFEESILETHRINHLLSLGRVIISERSQLDPVLDAYYEDVILFTEVDRMYDLAKSIIGNETERQRLEKRSYQKYLQIMSEEKPLQLAIHSIIQPFEGGNTSD